MVIAWVLCGALAQSPVPQNVAVTLEKALAAHGGEALTGMKTYLEDDVVNASVLGVGLYNLRFRTLVDFAGRRGRIEIFNNGTLQTIFQLTSQGSKQWTKKDGTKDGTLSLKPGAPFTFSTPIKAGVLGLLAIGKAADEKLSGSASVEVQGIKGASIQRDAKSYQATYVFGADGRFNLEKTVFINEKNEKTEFTLVYESFKTIGGVKIPMNAKIYSSQIPGFASANLEVKSVDVNPEFPSNAFDMP